MCPQISPGFSNLYMYYVHFIHTYKVKKKIHQEEPVVSMKILLKTTQLLMKITGHMLLNFNEYHEVQLNDRIVIFLPFTSQVWVYQQ